MNPPQSLHHLQLLSDDHGAKVKHLEIKALSKKNFHSITKLVAMIRANEKIVALENIK